MIHGVYAITPDGDVEANDERNADAASADLLSRTEKILLGGANVVQYRDKTSVYGEKLERARALVALCRQYDVPLIINDDIELACAAEAHGVHLGKDDSSIVEARERLGKEAIVGISCYASMRRAVQAQMHGATYVAFGAMFASKTKPLAPLAPLDLVTSATSTLDIPVVAIGGITPDNARSVVDAGADAIAVISALYNAADSKEAAATLAAMFTHSQP